MTTVLTLIITFTFIMIIYLIHNIQTEKEKFRVRLQFLEDFKVQLSKKQIIRENQLLLSEEFKQKLIFINTKLNNDIYELNLTAIEDLYPRK